MDKFVIIRLDEPPIFHNIASEDLDQLLGQCLGMQIEILRAQVNQTRRQMEQEVEHNREAAP